MTDTELKAGDAVPVPYSKLPLFEVFLAMEKRPGMFFAEYSIKALRTYIDGFTLGRNLESDSEYLTSFYQFVDKRLAKGNHPMGWDSLIEKHYGSEKAFPAFYELLREFEADRSR